MDNRKTPSFQDFAPYAFLASTRKKSEYMLFLYSEFPAGFKVTNTTVKYQKGKTKVTIAVIPVPTRPGETKRGEWAGKIKLTPKEKHDDFNPDKYVVEITVSVKRNALRIPNYTNTLSYTDCNIDPIPATDIKRQKAVNSPYVYLAVPPTNPNERHPDNFAYEPNLVMFLNGYELAKADEINTLSSTRNGVFETLIILKEKPGNEVTLKGDKLKTNKFIYYNSPGNGGNFTVTVRFVSNPDEAKRIRKLTTVERHLEDAKAEFPELNGQVLAARPMGPKPKKRKFKTRNMYPKKP